MEGRRPPFLKSPDGEPWTLETFTNAVGAKTTAVWNVLKFSNVYSSGRLDAEHFRPDYLAIENKVAKWSPISLGQIAAYINRGLQPVYQEDGSIPVLRTVNIREHGFSETRQDFVSNEFYRKNPRGQVRKGDILITSTGVGTLGRVAYHFEDKPYFADGHITIVREVRGLNPLFIVTFLQTSIGRALIERRQRGSSGQIEIYPADIASIPIPQPDEEFQNEIALLQEKAHQLRQKSESLYAQAEALLLAELGLKDLDHSCQPTYTRNFSEVWAAGRLDAEHFQPKYYALLDKIQETGQAIRLGDWLKEPIRRGVQPEYDEDGTIIVINSQHIGKTHIELEDNRRTTREFAAQNPHAVVRPYDVLLNSTGYITIGRCQTLLDDVSAIVDSHISIIRPKPGLDPVYLGMFLNSPAGQLQTERSWTGSSGQIELRRDLIENYLIWKPDRSLQRQIRDLVEDAHNARLEAKRLLKEAKRRVEAMILGEEA